MEGIGVSLTPEQLKWLRQGKKVKKSISAMIREIVDEAMANNRPFVSNDYNKFSRVTFKFRRDPKKLAFALKDINLPYNIEIIAKLQSLKELPFEVEKLENRILKLGTDSFDKLYNWYITKLLQDSQKLENIKKVII